jgi:spore maturation protein CgeB
MNHAPLRIAIIGLSITSSWGNGHATTYRGLVRELVARGHDVLFLECDVPWYAGHRDLPQPPFGRTVLYEDLGALQRNHAEDIGAADLVIVGSFVRDGVAVGDWVQAEASGLTAFYDIDTPVTLARLHEPPPGEAPYLEARQIAGYDLYLSFTGGPTLARLEREFGSPAARVLYCAVDPTLYFPEPLPLQWDLGYMGTYSDDRQPRVERLLLQPARQWHQGRFAVAGAKYPDGIDWPRNVQHIQHLPPAEHRAFYNRQRFTLNVTRDDMIEAGWSPSVRLFEAAACGTPIVSDRWEGIETLLEPGREIFLADSAAEVLRLLRELPEDERLAVGERARSRILAQHTAAHRAAQLETYVHALRAREAA